MRHITGKELRAYLDRAEHPPVLLDVREPWEYRICHIEGSRLIPMREIPSAFPSLDSQQETIVICHHGIRSRQVALYLEQQGFSDIVNLEGGVAGWARDVDPNMPTY